MSTSKVPSAIQRWSISEVVAHKRIAKEDAEKGLHQKYRISIAIDIDGKPFAVCNETDLRTMRIHMSSDDLVKLKETLMTKTLQCKNGAPDNDLGYPGGKFRASVNSVRTIFSLRPPATLIPPDRILTHSLPRTSS